MKFWTCHSWELFYLKAHTEIFLLPLVIGNIKTAIQCICPFRCSSLCCLFLIQKNKQSPVALTLVLGARLAMRAAAALPALFSSMNEMVELMTRSTMIPTKSCQSGGLPSPLASAIAMIAAISMTHESGFHMKPKNLRNLLSCATPKRERERERERVDFHFTVHLDGFDPKENR
jgi:hypothetical protein